MSLSAPVLLAPGPQFWPNVVRAIQARFGVARMRILVPAFSHAQQFKQALAPYAKEGLLAPRINTLAGWLAQQVPDQNQPSSASQSQRLLALYEQLRQQAWLKKLFGARSNTDLLPLAQLLLTLADELTTIHLPAIASQETNAAEKWQAALAQLPQASQELLSDEANLVWTLWQGQLDEQDGLVQYFARLKQLAARADTPLVWISPEIADPIEVAFLQEYARHQPVLRIHLDWREAALPEQLVHAWPEMVEQETHRNLFDSAAAAEPLALQHIQLLPGNDLEQQAQFGAQTVLNWLAQGKQNLAIVAQDRVVARRISALLARASVVVADETGWKLSTTRASAALAAWFEVVSSDAETMALLDFLKSPFVKLRTKNPISEHGAMVMAIELALRRANVLGGWDSVLKALPQQLPSNAQESALLLRIARKHAAQYSGRHSMQEWGAICRASLQALGMLGSLASDHAGRQILQMLEHISLEKERTLLAFNEWRAVVSLQMESLPFVPEHLDKRVAMLPLNGARLRYFEAILFVGADAKNLPSQAPETLFFANAVRRELGLATRESRQKQQMRDLSELLLMTPEVVLSWQAFKNNEPNPLSPWLERLQLTLAQKRLPALALHPISLPLQQLVRQQCDMPSPSAAALLPEKLSASAYNSFFACPYQFFARQMLHLSKLDELSDLPEKRDYGDWLHEILHKYHQSLLTQPDADKAALLQEISHQKFAHELEKSAAALGYFSRWQKSMPSYLAWSIDREAQGWHYVQGEQNFTRQLDWQGGGVTLRGRIDRIDHNEAGSAALLDYKTSSSASLRSKIKSHEDQQLPFYALLAAPAHAQIDDACFVALEAGQGKTESVHAVEFAQWRDELQSHIVRSLQALQRGNGLPANGVDSVCQYCDVRGLCRKGVW